MPARRQSDMLPSELVAWQQRHKLSPIAAADALGMTRRQFDRMCKADSGIPLTIERLCAALDLIHDHESVAAFTLSPRDMARICADPARKL